MQPLSNEAARYFHRYSETVVDLLFECGLYLEMKVVA